MEKRQGRMIEMTDIKSVAGSPPGKLKVCSSPEVTP